MGAGRHLNVETPEELLSLFDDYVISLTEEAEKWKKVQYVGKDGDRVEDAIKLPYTYEGFKRYAFRIGVGYIKQYFENTGDAYPQFLEVCSHIKNEIRENQITGGLINVFNPSITQRLNNLAEKVEGSVELKQITGMEVK